MTTWDLLTEGFFSLHFFTFIWLFFTFIVVFLQFRLQKEQFKFSETMILVMFNENYLALELINTTYIHTSNNLKKII